MILTHDNDVQHNKNTTVQTFAVAKWTAHHNNKKHNKQFYGYY